LNGRGKREKEKTSKASWGWKRKGRSHASKRSTWKRARVDPERRDWLVFEKVEEM